MNTALGAFVIQALDGPVRPEIKTTARMVGQKLNGCAVLFYGSILRTGDLDGVLDFYVLTAPRTGMSGRVTRIAPLWPDVSFHELVVGEQTLRAKVATMPIDVFERAAAGLSVDTTIWARFVQPAALVWSADAVIARRVVDAVSSAVTTAARFAAVLGPVSGNARDYWTSLFRQTYKAEFRVEAPGREADIVNFDPARYDALLPIAWHAADLGFVQETSIFTPQLDPAARHIIMKNWSHSVRYGKLLNLTRLVKAAFTFDGAARYGLWKIERHTGVRIALTPWRERHPILAAPGVLWRVMRTRAS